MQEKKERIRKIKTLCSYMFLYKCLYACAFFCVCVRAFVCLFEHSFWLLVWFRYVCLPLHKYPCLCLLLSQFLFFIICLLSALIIVLLSSLILHPEWPEKKKCTSLIDITRIEKYVEMLSKILFITPWSRKFPHLPVNCNLMMKTFLITRSPEPTEFYDHLV